jgi:hypothetical protein
MKNISIEYEDEIVEIGGLGTIPLDELFDMLEELLEIKIEYKKIKR